MEGISQTRIARFAHAGEVREVRLLTRAGGGAHIVQISWGPLTRAVYGQGAICQRLSLEADAAAQLAESQGWACGLEQGMRQFFSDEDAVLSDLLDVCSHAGIACRFCTLGSDVGSLSGRCANPPGLGGPMRGFSLVP